MKNNRVLLNLLIRVAKALPIAIAVSVVCGMLAYVVCVNLVPLTYCSVVEFVPDLPQGSGTDGLDIVSTDAFFSHVAEISSERVVVSTEQIRKILNTVSDDSGKITFSVRTSGALSSYYIAEAALDSAMYFYAAQDGGIAVISTPSIPTVPTREDISLYLILAAVLGFVLIVAVTVVRGVLSVSISDHKDDISESAAQTADRPIRKHRYASPSHAKAAVSNSADDGSVDDVE